jgi:hypothetical protein
MLTETDALRREQVLPYSKMQYCRAVRRPLQTREQANKAAEEGEEEMLEVFVRKSYDSLDVRKISSNFLLVFPPQVLPHYFFLFSQKNSSKNCLLVFSTQVLVLTHT